MSNSGHCCVTHNTYLLVFLALTPLYWFVFQHLPRWKDKHKETVKTKLSKTWKKLKNPQFSYVPRQQKHISYLHLKISDTILSWLSPFVFYDAAPVCLFTLAVAKIRLACLCLCFENYHNEKKPMVWLQVRGPQVQPVFHNNSKQEGTDAGGTWWQIPMRWWFRQCLARKVSWLHRTAEQPIETELIWPLLRHVLRSFSKLACEFVFQRLTKPCLSAAARVLLDIEMSHANLIQTHFLGQKRELFPAPKHQRGFALRLSSELRPPVFKHVFWQQRTAEEMKAGPRRIMFNRRSSRNKLFTIKFLIIGM